MKDNSLKTSLGNINRLPKGLKVLEELGLYKKVINFGAGLGYKKHQELIKGIELINYDPNIEEINTLPVEKADAIICNNVLNVIENDEIIELILDTIDSYKLPSYITVYEGDRTGEGKTTKTGTYQRNMKTKDYHLEKRGYKLIKGVWVRL